jgi:hypothetical protein
MYRDLNEHIDSFKRVGSSNASRRVRRRRIRPISRTNRLRTSGPKLFATKHPDHGRAIASLSCELSYPLIDVTWTDLLWRSRQRLSTLKLASQYGIERYFRDTFISELYFYRIAALDFKTLRTIVAGWRVAFDDCLQFYSRERRSMLEFPGENKIKRDIFKTDIYLPTLFFNCRLYDFGFNLNSTRKCQ